ncbi:hypothetical protein CDCA_CDCA20G4844 [Cyanidium caldarium]|uniref:Glycosyl hydrolase family 13 catalytic domain-containing protein n=1 Tax=Cyanidium caldarium TaxID=2771 RepID=A0AAV9J3D8_CYACA|nr:hypothetical protein CDCA_CDCA20G4844 [Cyanidium caldarium]
MRTPHLIALTVLVTCTVIVLLASLLGVVRLFPPAFLLLPSNAHLVVHDAYDERFRVPQGALERAIPFTVRVRAPRGLLTGVSVLLYNVAHQTVTKSAMHVGNYDADTEWWYSDYSLSTGEVASLLSYSFECSWRRGTFFLLYDAANLGVSRPARYPSLLESQWTVATYNPEFSTPDWLKDGVAVYHILPDRFRNGDRRNDPTPNNTYCYGAPVFYHASWHEPMYDPQEPDRPWTGAYQNQFYGGDLQGVLDKLDYLQDLGIDILYLMPVFQSPSYAGYDVSDFEGVSRALGGTDLLLRLTEEAHRRGMHVILDGIFGTASSDSVLFDRYRRFQRERGTVGACTSRDSPYHDFFTFIRTNIKGPCFDGNWYLSWWGRYDTLPTLRTEDPAVQMYMFRANHSIARRWLADPPGTDNTNNTSAAVSSGADGWRLDSPQQLSANFWAGFRQAVKTKNADACIIGEAWHFTGDSINHGAGWDSWTDYLVLSAVLQFWRDSELRDNDHDGSNPVLTPITATAFASRVYALQALYAPEAFHASLNMLSSHDTSRALFLLDHQAQRYDPSVYSRDYDWSDALSRLRGAFALIATLPGVPTIYYGDEVGLVAPQQLGAGSDRRLWSDDPYCRVTMPWLDEDRDAYQPWARHLRTESGQAYVRDTVRRLLHARREHAALRRGRYRLLLTDDERGVVAFVRGSYPEVPGMPVDIAVVVQYRGVPNRTERAEATVAIDVRDTDMPLRTVEYHDYMGVARSVNLDAASGTLYVTLPLRETAVVVPRNLSQLEAAWRRRPPMVPQVNVSVDHRGNMAVQLEWERQAGCDPDDGCVYVVKRSVLPDSGFREVGRAAAVPATADVSVQRVGYVDRLEPLRVSMPSGAPGSELGGRSLYYIVVPLDQQTGVAGTHTIPVSAFLPSHLDSAEGSEGGGVVEGVVGRARPYGIGLLLLFVMVTIVVCLYAVRYIGRRRRGGGGGGGGARVAAAVGAERQPLLGVTSRDA